MADKIEIFQDLQVDVAEHYRDRFLDALARSATAADGWSWDDERSRELAASIHDGRSVRFFLVADRQDLPSAGLGVWENESGFHVPNIVPVKQRELTRAQYNAVLTDFVDRVLVPVADRFQARIAITPSQQGPDDWMDAGTAENLLRFSRAANKSTGASHPADRRRWNAFLVSAHRKGDRLGADRLARWLREVEGWDMEGAYDLAAEYETAMELLAFYDGS